MRLLKLCLFLCFACFMLAAERSSEWHKVRKTHLRAHPVCEVCGIAKDLQVHHLKPFHLYPELELEPSNLITLCTSKNWGFNCHLIAGHGGNYQWENPDTAENAAGLKVVASPGYIRKHGFDDRDNYIKSIRKRVKEYNRK